MTGKQIEETLERNAKNIGDGFDSEVLNYINRLKAKIEQLSEEHEDMYMQNHNLQTYINNHEEIWKRNAEIDTAIVRK